MKNPRIQRPGGQSSTSSALQSSQRSWRPRTKESLIRTKTTTALLLLAYFGLLGLLYAFSVAKYFGYMGFNLEPTGEKLVVSAISIMAIGLIATNEGLVGKASYLIIALIFVPSCVLFSLANSSYAFFLTTLASVVIVLVVPRLISVPMVNALRLPANVLIAFLVGIVGVYFLAVIAQGGLRFVNFNLLEVYDFRRDAADNLHPVFAYLSSVVGKVIIPFLAVLAAQKRNYLIAIAAIGMGLFMFAFTAHKMPLFTPIAVLLVFYACNDHFGTRLILGCIALLATSALEFWVLRLFHSDSAGLFGSLFERRALLVPNLLNSHYIEFFSDNPAYFWSESRLSIGLTTNPYGMSAVNLIGQQYFGSADMSANTGWIGSGYANARIAGVIIYSLLLGLLISFLASIGKVIGERYVFSVSFTVLFSLITSTDIITSLLTHGLLALIVLLLFAPENLVGKRDLITQSLAKALREPAEHQSPGEIIGSRSQR